MALPYTPPDEEQIVLSNIDTGAQLTDWTSYSFNSAFLSPTDQWNLMTSGPPTDKALSAFKLGDRISLSVQGATQAGGYIDEIEIKNSRSGGTEVRIGGRDWLASMVDSSADVTLRFGVNSTFADILKGVAAPYGWSTDDQFVVSSDANRKVVTGGKYGTPTTKGGTTKTGKTIAVKPLKSYVTHLEKPFPGEGAFAFVARVAKRQGLWIWASADGSQLILDKPDFEQSPIFTLRRFIGTSGTANNILDGSCKRSSIDQPSVVIADGFGGGGEFGKSRLTVIAANPTVDVDISAILAKFPQAIPVELESTGLPAYPGRIAKPMYMHDDQAKTIEQLQNFVKKELANKRSRAFEYRCTVEGHTNNGAVWNVDTMVDVQDEITGVSSPLWVKERTFEKSRDGGTTTHLTLIPPYALDF